MRSIITYFLILFYFTISIGISLNFHLCQGKIRTVSFIKYDNDYTCCGKKKMKKGCCNNVSISINKLSKDKITQLCKANLIFDFPIVLPQSFDFKIKLKKHKAIHPLKIHPPPIVGSYPDIYIQNCVFRI